MIRLNSIERRLKDYAKAIKERAIRESETKLNSSKLRTSKDKQENNPLNEENSDKLAKLKSRIKQLESSNSMYKEKCDKIMKENEAEKEKNKKSADIIERLKCTQRIDKMKEESAKKDIAKAELLKSSAKPKEKPIEKPQCTTVSLQNEKSITEVIHLLSIYIENQIAALSKTKDIYLPEQESNITIGEMLFPKFNELLPSMLEIESYVYLHSIKIKQPIDISPNFMKLLWEMVSFAYSKYIFPRHLQNVMNPKVITNSSIRNFIREFPIPENKLCSKVPFKLEFVPMTKKVNKDISLHTKCLDFDATPEFPLFPLFKNPTLSLYFTKFIISNICKDSFNSDMMCTLLTPSKDEFSANLAKIKSEFESNAYDGVKHIEKWRVLITLLFYKESNHSVIQMLFSKLKSENAKENLMKVLSDEFCFEV